MTKQNKKVFQYKYASKGAYKITINNKDICEKCQNKRLFTIVKLGDYFKFKGLLLKIVKIIKNEIYLEDGTYIIS